MICSQKSSLPIDGVGTERGELRNDSEQPFSGDVFQWRRI
jgi:hypothetical protein